MQNDNKKYPVEHRNAQLKSIFENAGYAVKLIGDYNQPKIIINEQFAVSGYVQNRLYHFTTESFGGEVIRTINLNRPDLSKTELAEIFANNIQRKFWRLALSNDNDCYFVKTEKNIPLFAFNDSRYWFDKQKALITKKYLSEDFGICCTLK